MIRNRRRMIAVASAAACTIVPALSACGAGTRPQTAQPTQLTEGVNVTTKNGVAVRNLFVLGPQPGQRLAAGSAATVYAAVINKGTGGQPDRLIGVSAGGAAQSAQIQGGGIDLPYQRLVQLGVPSPSGITTPLLILQGLTMPLSGGESIKLTLQFQRAGALEATVPVVPQQGSYLTYAPAPAGSPTVAPAGSAGPSGSATPSRSASPSASNSAASPSPTPSS